MAEKSTRAVKLNGFSAIAAIVSGSLLLIGGWVGLGQWLSSNSQSVSEVSLSRSERNSKLSSTLDTVNSVPEPILAQNSTGTTASTLPNEGAQGVLRVGNVSDHPVRVALLLKKGGQAKNAAERYEPPAHWDFAPGEGRTKGLLLSLPNRSIKVKKGDILVAFAQDGSRRYWGPYVVGETGTPEWNASTSEWELILTP